LNSSMQNLRAGRLTLQYADGSIWNVRSGEEEVIRRIYLVFQDANWTSRPFSILKENWDIEEDNFSAEIELCGTKDARHFKANLKITGSPTGEIRYGFSGASTEDFMRNRLGLCLLHPIANLAGKSCILTLSDGSAVNSHFPIEISPNQPFKNLSGISHELSTGDRVSVEFSGEIFETEDHRNWSDASYKTYSTPIELPYPVKISKGSEMEQEVLISLVADSPAVNNLIEDKIIITVSDSEVSLPDIGLNFAEEYLTEDHKEFDQLGIKHLRLNLDLDNSSAVRISKALEITKKLNLDLDLALKTETSEQIEEFLSGNLHLIESVRNLLIFSKVDKVTPEDFIFVARKILGEDKSISGGTDLYFTEINRGRAVVPGIDQINFSINPQVHSFDDRTLIQNLATQEVIGINAARIAQSLRVSVGPISLRPRFNPNATDPERDVSNTLLPASVDIRQLTWFAEAWAAISIKYLAQSNSINSATFFETLGWRGIRESVAGGKDPDNFPSQAGRAFPVWDLFTSLKGFSSCILSYSNDPESVDSLVIKNSEVTRLILVNFSGEAKQVHFHGIDFSPVVLPPTSTTYLDI
jgi:hypothetical protein